MFCCHAGIGSTVNKIEDIEKIQRPIQVTLNDVSNADQQTLIDLLWSDPVDAEEENTSLDVVPNTIRDPSGTNNITKFGT